MPAPPVYGLGTGQDHSKTIQKLLQIERIPIRRMQRTNRDMQGRIQAWRKSQTLVRKLSDQSRLLYSFAGPFRLKRLISSDPGAVTGQASAGGETGEQSIEVLQLARKHQIHSGKLGTEAKLPPASFTISVGDKDFKYKFSGGRPSALLRLLRAKTGRNFSVTRVRVDEENVIFSFQSKVSGKRGAFRFQDPQGFLKRIGLAKVAPGKEETREISLRQSQVRPYSASGKNPRDSKARVSSDGRGLRLVGPGVWRLDLSLPPEAKLSLKYSAKDAPPVGESKGEKGEKGKTGPGDSPEKKSKKTGPGAAAGKGETTKTGEKDKKGASGRRESLKHGPDLTIRVEKIRLKGYDISRERVVAGKKSGSEKKETGKSTEPGKTAGAGKTTGPGKTPGGKIDPRNIPGGLGMGLIWKDGNEESVRNIPLERFFAMKDREFSIGGMTGGRTLVGLYFYQKGEGEAVFRRLRVKSRGKDGSGALVAAHATSPAQDAKLRIQGVIVTRSKNDGITDIIKGASLNLKRVTKGPVTVRVEPNTDKIIKNIRDWVKAYNDLLGFLRRNTRSGFTRDTLRNRHRQNDLGRSIAEVRRNSGLFAGDATARILISTIRQVTARAYPSQTPVQYRVLDDIGVSTGRPGSRFEEVRQGLLKIDEAKLKTALLRSADAVRELFASDVNSDNRMDNGAAFQMRKVLTPYARVSGGMLSLRIQMLNDRIADNKRRIRRKEMSVRFVEKRLRRKFGGMERAIGRSKATRRYLRSRMPGFGSGGGR